MTTGSMPPQPSPATSSPARPLVRCTVLPHPSGGYAPVPHHGEQPPASAPERAISLPTVADAVRYAMNHFGLTSSEVASSRG